MKCTFCGGELKKTTVTFSYEEDEIYILVEHVPAEEHREEHRDVVSLLLYSCESGVPPRRSRLKAALTGHGGQLPKWRSRPKK